MKLITVIAGCSILFAIPGFTQTFTSSNLPIVIIDTHGGVIVDDPKISATMGIINNGPGVRNNVTDTQNDFKGTIGIEIRGSSSQMFPKKQYGLEIQDALGNGIDASLLGLPKKDDWILYAAYDDKSLMRDALAYRLGRAQGRYASRSKYCEVVLNGDYMGVFILLEKVKRDKNRVNIAKLDPTSTSGNNLTGGYIIKLDKSTGTGGAGWTSAINPIGSTAYQHIFFQYEYPKQEDIVPEQITYIRQSVDAFEGALAGDNFKDPVNGYAKYIDVPSFVDYFLINEITKNPDAYRLSTFFYKQKDSDGGKIFMGPIWDYNEGFGNVNYCTQGNPEGFAIRFNYVCPEDYWQIPFWWDRLFQDPAFAKLTTDRWATLRSGPYQRDKIQGYVDSVASVLNAEAQQRNFIKWPILGQYVWPNYYVGATYQDEVNWLKQWIDDRLAWMDANLAGITTGIDQEKKFSFQLYPNPFAQEMNFQYELDQPGLLSIEVKDLLGRTVDHVDRNHDKEGKYQMNLNVSSLAAGTYIIQARFADKIVTTKAIKRTW